MLPLQTLVTLKYFVPCSRFTTVQNCWPARHSSSLTRQEERAGGMTMKHSLRCLSTGSAWKEIASRCTSNVCPALQACLGLVCPSNRHVSSFLPFLPVLTSGHEWDPLIPIPLHHVQSDRDSPFHCEDINPVLAHSRFWRARSDEPRVKLAAIFGKGFGNKRLINRARHTLAVASISSQALLQISCCSHVTVAPCAVRVHHSAIRHFPPLCACPAYGYCTEGRKKLRIMMMAVWRLRVDLIPNSGYRPNLLLTDRITGNRSEVKFRKFALKQRKCVVCFRTLLTVSKSIHFTFLLLLFFVLFCFVFCFLLTGPRCMSDITTRRQLEQRRKLFCDSWCCLRA